MADASTSRARPTPTHRLELTGLENRLPPNTPFNPAQGGLYGALVAFSETESFTVVPPDLLSSPSDPTVARTPTFTPAHDMVWVDMSRPEALHEAAAEQGQAGGEQPPPPPEPPAWSPDPVQFVSTTDLLRDTTSVAVLDDAEADLSDVLAQAENTADAGGTLDASSSSTAAIGDGGGSSGSVSSDGSAAPAGGGGGGGAAPADGSAGFAQFLPVDQAASPALLVGANSAASDSATASTLAPLTATDTTASGTAAGATAATQDGVAASSSSVDAAPVSDVVPGPPAPAIPAPAPPTPHLIFEANAGQTDAAVQFVARAPGATLFLTSGDAVLASEHPAADSTGDTIHDVVRLHLVGADPQATATGTGTGLLDAHSNYLLGNDPSQWQTDVPNYSGVSYQNVYQGIDLAYHGGPAGQLEYDFTVAPGASVDAIQFQVQGAQTLALDEAGNLVVTTDSGAPFVHEAPTVYQDLGGQRQAVDGHFTLSGDIVGFTVGAYDPSAALVIDPTVSYASYSGGSSADISYATAVDGSGNAYFTGTTASTNYPTVTGSYRTTAPGSASVFVTKMNAAGTALSYSTYLGGTLNTSTQVGYGIAVDANGAVAVCGQTTSTNFPTTAGVWQMTYIGGGTSGFLVTLNPAGSALYWGTYLGNSGDSSAQGVGLIGAILGGTGAPGPLPASVWVTGWTTATAANFPISLSALQSTNAGGQDAFLTGQTYAGAPMYSSFLGGGGTDAGQSVAVSAGHLYATGKTTSTNFPLSSAAQTSNAGGQDAFVTAVGYNASTSTYSYTYSTYLGGSGTDVGWGITVDSSDNAYVGGGTNSGNLATSGVYQSAIAGGTDAFAAKLTSSGSVSYLTYYGGSGNDAASSVTLLGGTDLVLAGTTTSTDLPTVAAVQPLAAGSDDGFVARFNSTATQLVAATYWGGSGADDVYGVAATGNAGSDVVLAGSTTSSDMPVTATAPQTSNGGGTDAFVVEVSMAPLPPFGDVDGDGPGACACGADGGDPASLGISSSGVRYPDGAAVSSATDLESAGFGTTWGHHRSWAGGSGFAARSVNGNGWVIDELPYLLVANKLNTIVAVLNGTDAVFFDLVGSNYQARNFSLDTFAADSSAGQYVLTTTTGSVLRFWDFSNSRPPRKRGAFASYTDPNGTVTSVTSWNSDGTPAEVQRSGGGVTESYLYAYLSTGSNAGLLSSVTLRRQPSGGSWSTVRQVVYSYYDGTTSGGNNRDLKYATIEDASGNALDTWYYRYYKPGDANGYAGALKLVFAPDSYARLYAYLGATIETSSDSTVAPYADDYFQYDAQKRATQGIVQAAGSSTGSSLGLGTYGYVYSTSSNADGYNSWETKAVETLPDGTTHTVYANYAGEVMLDVVSSGGSQWITFHQYDGAGRLILTANPSAVSGYDESKADLLNSVSNNYQYLRDTTGLLELTVYATTTTATSTTAGNVAGYVYQTEVQRGELGTPIVLHATQYLLHTAGSITVDPVATETDYANSDGTGARTTSYSYTWFTGTNLVQSVTVTLPTVSTSENGPGTADTDTTYFDVYGNAIWHKDGDGFLNYAAYDIATAAVTKSIVDVDTTRTSDFTGLPTGWSTPSGGGLHLITTDEVDGLGRTTKETDPNGNVNYIVYIDTNHEIREYDGWQTSSNTPTGPTKVLREDRGHITGYTETLTMSATPTVSAGRPTGAESIASLQTWARTYVSAGGQVNRSDDYFSFTGAAYSTALYPGVSGSNDYTTTPDYDAGGRGSRMLSPTGTITRTVYDALGRPVSTWVGTNDTPTSGAWSPTNNTGTANMVQISALQYDGGGVGDSNLTQVTEYPGGSAAARVTQYFFDWRDRQVAVKAGVQGSESSSVHRPISYVELNNLDEVTASERYDGDGVSIVDANGDGVPDKPSSSLLRARSTAAYDEQGRVYETHVYSVNPSSGAISSTSLTSDTWFNHRGDVVKTAGPDQPVQKTAYDGAGRVVSEYTTDGGGDSSWSDALNVTGDAVFQQVDMTYDGDGNAILVTARQRFHDETGTGALGTPTSGVHARVSYLANYYDAANRLTDSADVGTNGGSSYTRPSSVPARSDTVLVSSSTYNAAGWVATTTDPRGLVNQITYDPLGRVTKTIEDYTDGMPTANSNKTTEQTYDGADHVLTVKVDLPMQATQTTLFLYGVTTATGSDVNSNDLLSATEFPDKSSGAASTAEKESYTVNALGETKTSTDRNGNVHTYSYDVLGRPTADAVTTLGSGVDGAVRRLETAYDGQGNPYLFTSYDAASGGNVVNQVQDVFNGLGQLTTEYQEHSGAVNTSTSAKVQYAYVEMASGANSSRPTTLTYPNGRVLTYNYSTGVDSTISRLSSISDGSTTLESYAYLGLDTVVKRSHPQPGVDLTYVKLTGESNGDAGDQYIGLDRFGRVVDQRWVTSGGIATDRFQYGYDRDGNVLYRDNKVNSAFGELYHANGASNGYDNLNQLTDFRRGTLTDTNLDGIPDTVATASRSQSFTADAAGNFSSVTSDGTATSRTNNRQNQLTAVGAATLAFDANGNLTTDENGKALVYDAWNRLVAYKNGSTVLDAYAYDAMGRRIKENPGTARDLYYSDQWQVLEERVSGAAQVQYVWSAVYVDALIERDRDADGLSNNGLEERLYAQQDANWNVTALVGGGGGVVERYVYDPFGAISYLSAAWATATASGYGWRINRQGTLHETSTGLDYNRGRDYSPTEQRWIEVDPTRFGAGDINFYRAEGNKPTNGTDPSGLQGTKITIDKRGDPFPADAIGGGKIEVKDGPNGKIQMNKGVDFTVKEDCKVLPYKNAVAIEYKGTERRKVALVQFVWAEMLITHKKQGKDVEERFPFTWRTSIGRMRSTVDKDNPIWFVDAVSKESPDYLAGGRGLLGADFVTLLDKPGRSLISLAVEDKKFGGNRLVSKMKFVLHFETYAIYNRRSIYKVAWTTTYTWERGGNIEGPFYDTDKDESGPNKQPSRRQKDALIAKYGKKNPVLDTD